MTKFMLMIRMLLRDSYAIALMTVCVDALVSVRFIITFYVNLKETIEIEKVRIYSDAVIRLETFSSDIATRTIISADQFHG